MAFQFVENAAYHFPVGECLTAWQGIELVRCDRTRCRGNSSDRQVFRMDRLPQAAGSAHQWHKSKPAHQPRQRRDIVSRPSAYINVGRSIVQPILFCSQAAAICCLASARDFNISRSAATSLSSFVMTLVELKTMTRFNEGLSRCGSAAGSRIVFPVKLKCSERRKAPRLGFLEVP